MDKKTLGAIALVVVLIIGAFAAGNYYANWQFQQQHYGMGGHGMGGGMMGGGMGHGMGGGSNSNNSNAVGSTGDTLPLTAVTADGAQIPANATVEKITGKLAAGSAAQQVGETIVVFTINPYPATMRQTTNFAVTLTDAAGNAINDAQVTLDLTMPEMWMPPNKPALQFAADGKYAADGQFTMRGWWRVEVIITRDGQSQSAFFDLGL